MNATTKFIIIRHGQSLGNVQEIYLGHTDWDLSELGKKQAEDTAKALKDEHIDAVYSSDLLRAYNTALASAKAHGLEVIKSENLREIFIGDWEGMRTKDLAIQYPKEYLVDWKEHFGTFTAPGGESIPHTAERIHNELLRIAEENVGKTVIIASHAAAIRALWGKISGIAPENLSTALQFPSNASYSIAEYRDGKIYPVKYSVDDHIETVTKIS